MTQFFFCQFVNAFFFSFFRTKTILWLCRFGESSYDMLFEQFASSTVHDTGISKRIIQLGIRWT